MNEIKTSDLPEIKSPEQQNFKEIRPQEGMTPKEANDFWNQEVSPNDPKDLTGDFYTDDNGEIYKEGDHLLPNNSYEVNGYKYETDDQGRIVSAGGKLRIAPPSSREMDSMKKIGKGDEQEGDHRGHLIARWFGGSDKMENLVAMDGELNTGEYSKMEHELYSALNQGADVRLKVESVYEGSSNRPSEFRAIYQIDGDTTVKVFRNGGKET